MGDYQLETWNPVPGTSNTIVTIIVKPKQAWYLAYRMMRLAVAILLMLLQACGEMRLQALPDPIANLDLERRAISKRLAGADVTVQVAAWRDRPRRLTDDFLPVLVGIANHSRGPMTLRVAEVALIDDQDRRRRPLRPEEVVSLLLGGSEASAIVPSVGIEASGPEPTFFGVELGLDFNRHRDLRNIPRRAFPLDPIPPDSHAEGFLYFPNHPRDARRLTLFIVLDTPTGRQELAFFYAINR